MRLTVKQLKADIERLLEEMKIKLHRCDAGQLEAHQRCDRMRNYIEDEMKAKEAADDELLIVMLEHRDEWRSELRKSVERAEVARQEYQLELSKLRKELYRELDHRTLDKAMAYDKFFSALDALRSERADAIKKAVDIEWHKISRLPEELRAECRREYEDFVDAKSSEQRAEFWRRLNDLRSSIQSNLDALRANQSDS